MTTDGLQEFSLGGEAIEYIVESLRSCNELSAMLLETFKFESGTVVTYVPVGTADPGLKDLRTGGILRAQTPTEALAESAEGEPTYVSAIPNLDNFLASLVIAHLRSQQSAICLFENHLARLGDPWLGRTRLHTLAAGKTVCHYLIPEDYLDAELVDLTIKKSRSIRPPLVGVLARLNEGVTTAEVGNLNQHRIRTVLERTEMVIVGAYDGESFIIWRPASLRD